MVRITQVHESPRSISISVDLNFPLNGVPHWMTETLAGSALMKMASKCSETLLEYRSSYENPVGEVSGSDIMRISLDLSFTKSQDELVHPLSICTWNWCRILLQLSRSGTRMVWESIASLRPSLGQARWNLSPPNRPLGFVKSKPSKPPRDGPSS